MEIGLHHGSAMNILSFAVAMDRLADEVRKESQWAYRTL